MSASTQPARSLAHRLVGGGAWAVGGTLATLVAGTVANVVLARLLQPDDFGVYFLLLSVVTVFATVARLGLDVAVVRLVSGAESEGRTADAAGAIASLLRVSGCSAILVGAVLGLVGIEWLGEAVFHAPRMREVALATAIWTGAEALRLVASEAFRGFNDFARASLFGNGTRGVLVAVLLGVLAFTGNGSLPLVIWSVTLASLVTVGGALLALRRRLRRIRLAPLLQTRMVLGTGLPMMVAVLAALALAQGDIWVVGSVSSPTDVAIYGAAARIVVLLAVPLIVVNAVVPPIIVELRAGGRVEELEHVLRATTTAATIPMIAVFGAIALLGGTVLELVYGPFYRQGSAVLLFLAAGQVINVALGPCGTVLLMVGRERLVMLVTVLAAGTTLAAQLLTAQHFGISGVAGSAAGGLAVFNCVLLVLARRHVGVWTSTFLSPRRAMSSVRALRHKPPLDQQARP